MQTPGEPPLHGGPPLRRRLHAGRGSKNIGFASPPHNNPTVNPFLDIRARNYAPAGRTHNLAINYSYQIPGLSQLLGQRASSAAIFDGWEISGVTSALSGRRRSASTLLDRGGERPDRRRRRRRRHARGPHRRSEPPARRTERHAGVRHECRRGRRRDPNRVGTAGGDELIGPGYLELGHLVPQEHPARRHAAAAVPLRAVQRVQQRAVLDGEHQREVQCGGRSRPIPSSASTPRRATRGGSSSRSGRNSSLATAALSRRRGSRSIRAAIRPALGGLAGSAGGCGSGLAPAAQRPARAAVDARCDSAGPAPGRLAARRLR